MGWTLWFTLEKITAMELGEMSTQNQSDFQKDVWPKIHKVIDEIVEKSADGDYIFRGESELHPEVCSGLYRSFPHHRRMRFDVPTRQQAMLAEAKKYTAKTDDFEILAELQHFGGTTNLIDFTTDYLIALLYACDGHYEKDGRVILVKKESEVEKGLEDYYKVKLPPRTISRAEFQRGVFVEARKGFIHSSLCKVVTIPADLKEHMLKYLEQHHSISVKAVYNDLHGFIERSAPAAVLKGFACQDKANKTDNWNDQKKGYEESIEHYTEAIRINPQWIHAYYDRGRVYLLKKQAARRAHENNKCKLDDSELQQAIDDFNKLINLPTSHPYYKTYCADAHCGLGMVYHLKGKFYLAIENYSAAIGLQRESPAAYCNRGEAWLHLKQWEKAKADLTKATSMGEDIVASFHYDYKSVREFEKKNRCRVPRDIKKMLEKKKEGRIGIIPRGR